MSRPPGLPKSGGRQKGTPNKKSLIATKLNDALLINEYDVVGELLKTIELLSPEDKAQNLLKLMEFVYPKQKMTANLNIENKVEDSSLNTVVNFIIPDNGRGSNSAN